MKARSLVSVCWLSIFALTSVAAEPLAVQQLKAIDDICLAAIKKGDCPGAVVLVVHQQEVVYRNAFGNSRLFPEPKPMTVDRIFDLASLTKPIATATAIHLLHQQGKLAFNDPVSKHWPDFKANGKETVTIEHLLIHTSGLIADNALADYKLGKDEALKRITQLKLEQPPGEKFKYSDVGFIVLGHLVERISGESLDTFTRKNIFETLGMKHTGFNPKPENKELLVPTAKVNDEWLQGTVHDPRARATGGVAGHAGLFSTADDLAIYAKILLHTGEHQGRVFLKPEAFKLMTEPIAVPSGSRSRGWDVDTSFSSPRGNLFGPKDGFGHTGYTGTSIWVDRPSKTAIIILTNRVHISDKVQVTLLRKQVADAVANALGRTAEKKSP